MSHIFIVSHQPLITDVILLALPTFMEHGHPNHDNQAVDDTQWRRKKIVPSTFLYNSIDDHDDSNHEADNGHWDQPTSVVDQPSEVEAKLLAIVVLDKVEWLHVFEETVSDHASRQAPPVIYPRRVDLRAFGHVYWEVVLNHTAIFQIVHVYLRLERLRNNSLVLATVKLVKHVSSVAPERLLAVILGQAALDVQDFTHEIHYAVIEEKHDHHDITCALLLIEVLGGLDFVKKGVIDTAAAHKRVKLHTQDLESVKSCHDAVVWSLIMSQLLFSCELSVELKAVVICGIFQIIVFSTGKDLLDYRI